MLLPVLRGFWLLLVTPSVAFGQASSPAPQDPAWQLTPYFGIARNSPVGNFLGLTPGRNHLFVGVHITATVARSGRWSLAYAPEVVPLLLLSDTPTYHVHGTTAEGFPKYIVDGLSSVAGFGASPVGFELQVRAGTGWRVYAATAAGFLKFTRNTPDPDAREFNYSFEYGGGVEVQVHPDWWLRLGYKFHHFSNGYSAAANPGVDGHVWLVGVGRGFGRR